jgi:hypothetical protein
MYGAMYREATSDPRVRGFALNLYLGLYAEYLDTATFLPVHVEATAIRFRRHPDSIQRGLLLLVDLGYIEKGPTAPGETRTYRLVWRRSASPAPEHAAATEIAVARRALRRLRRGINPGQRFRVLQRDRFTCQYCGRSAPAVVLQVDHIVPLAGGGPNTDANLATACVECNGGKGGKPLSA